MVSIVTNVSRTKHPYAWKEALSVHLLPYLEVGAELGRNVPTIFNRMTASRRSYGLSEQRESAEAEIRRALSGLVRRRWVERIERKSGDTYHLTHEGVFMRTLMHPDSVLLVG